MLIVRTRHSLVGKRWLAVSYSLQGGTVTDSRSLCKSMLDVVLYYCTGRAKVTQVTRAFKIECNSFVNNYSDYGQAARIHTQTSPQRKL